MIALHETPCAALREKDLWVWEGRVFREVGAADSPLALHSPQSPGTLPRCPSPVWLAEVAPPVELRCLTLIMPHVRVDLLSSAFLIVGLVLGRFEQERAQLRAEMNSMQATDLGP